MTCPACQSTRYYGNEFREPLRMYFSGVHPPPLKRAGAPIWETVFKRWIVWRCQECKHEERKDLPENSETF